MKHSLPLIAVPMGDPAGIGPEIVIKAVHHPGINALARCVVIGDADTLKAAAAFTHLKTEIKSVDHPEQGIYRRGVLNLIDLKNIPPEGFVIGKISANCGRAAYTYIEKAVNMAMAGTVAAVTTTPIHKEALKAARIPFIGHTEIFGALTETPDPLTMFEVHNLRIFFLTRHLSLRDACNAVTKERIIDYVLRCSRALKDLKVTEGTMAVAGLNPHSGDGGLFGDEEICAISPAVKVLQDRGVAVAGPIPADSVFYQTLKGKYNSVLSLYHDQGHIAAKTLDFERTVSVTCGMPILRTSVDHGTAFDIAGLGVASPVSLIEAIRVAVKYLR